MKDESLEIRVAKIEQALKGNGMKGIIELLDDLYKDFKEYKETSVGRCHYLRDKGETEKRERSWWMKHGILVKDISVLIAVAGLIITVVRTL